MMVTAARQATACATGHRQTGPACGRPPPPPWPRTDRPFPKESGNRNSNFPRPAGNWIRARSTTLLPGQGRTLNTSPNFTRRASRRRRSRGRSRQARGRALQLSSADWFSVTTLLAPPQPKRHGSNVEKAVRTGWKRVGFVYGCSHKHQATQAWPSRNTYSPSRSCRLLTALPPIPSPGPPKVALRGRQGVPGHAEHSK